MRDKILMLPKSSKSELISKCDNDDYHILIADDILGIRRHHSDIIEKIGTTNGYKFYIHTAQSKKKALDLFTEHPNISIALIDVKMESAKAGVELVDYIRNVIKNEIVQIILITTPAIQKEYEALSKFGINKYLEKGKFDEEKLGGTVIACLREYKKLKKLKDDYEKQKKEIAEIKLKEYQLIGKNEIWINSVISQIEKIAKKNDSNALICGETGTGKENIAKQIHYKSSRFNKPFIALQISSLPETLQESILFGYEKGAHNMAFKSSKGKLEEANEGTLFLDEIGTLSISSQIMLLRALEEKKIYRIGGHDEIKIDIRVLSATNEDLPKLIKENKFRQDLYFRISNQRINVPPLRNRKDDIELLANYFLNKINESDGNKKTGFTNEAIAKLKKHIWSGNVRELKYVIDNAISNSENDPIADSDIIFDESFYYIFSENDESHIFDSRIKSSSNITDEQLEKFPIEKINELDERKVFIELNKFKKRNGLWNIQYVAEEEYKSSREVFRLKIINIFNDRLQDFECDFSKILEWRKQRNIDDINLIWLIESWLTFKFKKWKNQTRIELEGIITEVLKTSKKNVKELLDLIYS
jgi:DNA-binding NtrC family response regulator